MAYELESVFAVRRSAIAEIFTELRNVLKGPKPANPDARLHITFAPPIVKYINQPTILEVGLVLPLKPVFHRVDGYLGAHDSIQQGIPEEPRMDAERLAPIARKKVAKRESAHRSLK